MCVLSSKHLSSPTHKPKPRPQISHFKFAPKDTIVQSYQDQKPISKIQQLIRSCAAMRYAILLPLISGDLGIVASAETLHGVSLLGFLGLCISWDRLVSYHTWIRAWNARITDNRRSQYCHNQKRWNFAWCFVIRLSWTTKKLGSICFVSNPKMTPNRLNHW